MNVEFATETEITAVAISKDDNFITNASYNKSDNTVSLWNHSIESDTFHDNGYIKINLEEKAPLNDKIDLTISKLIPSSNSRFVILSYLFKENDSSKVKAVFIVLQWENDITVVTINSENDPVDKAKTVLDEPMDEAKILFKVFKNGKKSEADILGKVKNKIEAEFSKIEDGFINAEFLADGVILAIKYKTTIQFVSIASGPWTLFNIDDFCLGNKYSRNQDVFNIDESEVALAFNPLKHESYVLLPWRGKKIVDMVRINVLISYKKSTIEFHRISCISNISKIQSIVDKKVVMSSTSDLLAFENGPIVEKRTGLHIANIAEEHVSSNKKDFTFMNDDRHLFIVYSDETSLKAILIDACSGTELKSVKTPPEPELANLKHIQLINGYVITVTSNKNNAVIKKWHWKEFFCNQLKKMQLEEWQSEKWQVKGILLPSNFDFNNFDFDNFVLKEKSDINIDDDADCFFLFWKERKNNSETRCLVWMHGEIENSGNNPTIKIKFDVDVDGILRLYDENKDEEFYTFLPLSSAIKDKNLPAEWVQSSCNYLKKRNLNNSLKEIIINTIRQYVDNNVFNGTTAIFDLIDSDASDDVDIIIMSILSYKKYMPTGLYEKNPLTKAIEKENIVLVGKILEYCLHVHYFRNYEPGFMSMIVDALPSLADKYPEMLLKLLEQCTCLKVPSDWEIGFQGGYSTKNHKIRDLNRYTKQPASLTAKNLYIDPYSATYCHIPLYNLCHRRDTLLHHSPPLKSKFDFPFFSHFLHFPLSKFKKFKRIYSYDNLSPFAKLTCLQSSEVFQSTLFETIVTHRIMNAYYYLIFYLFYYIFYFCLFLAATITPKSNPASRRKMMFWSISFGLSWAVIFILRLLANFFIFKFTKYKTKKAKKFFTTSIELAALILPLTTAYLEYKNKTAPPEFRSLSILFLWIFIFLQLRFTKKIGMFIAGKNFSKTYLLKRSTNFTDDLTILPFKVFTNLFEQIMPLLIFLFFILFAYAHSLMVLLSEVSPDNGVNTFTSFYQSIKNTWLILLNDYSSLEPWTKNYLLDILMITFSLSTAIILFNVLSMH